MPVRPPVAAYVRVSSKAQDLATQRAAADVQAPPRVGDLMQIRSMDPNEKEPKRYEVMQVLWDLDVNVIVLSVRQTHLTGPN
jgi:hypothetical protein